MAKRKRTEDASTVSSIRSASPAVTSPHAQVTHETPRKKYRKYKRISKANDYFSDSPYRGKGHVTPSESDSDEAKALRPRSLISSRKRRRRCTAERNPKDPFECLGDDVVRIIIAHLPAITTEILRRVSKHWKFLSEYHNGNEALQRYFGHVEQRKPKHTNREEANLRFRRRLYHEQSLKAGRATSGFDLTNASSWHINNGRLLWASYRNTYTIRTLSRQPGLIAADTEVNLNDFPWMKKKFLYLANILLTENGDVVVVNECSASEDAARNLSDPLESHYIRRLSPSGKQVMWEVFVSTTGRGIKYVYGKAAVDNSSIYRIETLKAVLTDREYPLYFVARSLDDGTTTLKKKLPETLSNSICDWLGKIPRSEDLELRTRGTWAVHAASRSPEVTIFSTSTGEVLTSYHRNMPSTLVLAPRGNAIYTLDFRFRNANPSDFLEWDPATSQFTRSSRHLLQQYCSNTSGLGFDPDRKLFFRIKHSLQRPETISGTNDPHTQFGVINATEERSYSGFGPRAPDNVPSHDCKHNEHAYIEGEGTALVTLPAFAIGEKRKRVRGRTKTKTKELAVEERRLLEMAAPWAIRGGDFYGMTDDYLVYYAKGEHRLMVVDFWPTW